MNKQDVIKLQNLASGVGQFIRYWGFRNIHGEIWSIVFLHQNPLSGIEIGQILNVSKALVSPALKELVEEGLIKQIQSENSKTKRYVAEEDVVKIIQSVLKRRESIMLKEILKKHSDLCQQNNPNLNSERLEKMGKMIILAQLGLSSLLESDLMNIE